MDFSLLAALSSADNQERPRAEIMMNVQLERDPVSVVSLMLKGVCEAPDLGQRVLAAVLLRRLVKPNGEVWPRLGADVQAGVRQGAWAALQQPALDRTVHRKLCHVLAQMAPAWPELLNMVVQMAQSGDAGAQQTALFLLAKMSEYASDPMLPFASQLMDMYNGALAQHGQLPTQLLGLQAAAGLLSVLHPPEDFLQFRPIVPAMLSVIGAALTAGEELEACEGLTALIDLARTCPTFMRDCLDDLAASMMQVTAAEALEQGTRSLAMELLVTLSEAQPAMVRPHTQLVQNMVQLSLQLCAAAEEEDAEFAQGSYAATYIIDDELCEVGQDALDRLGCSLGGGVVAGPAFAQLAPMFQSGDWKQRRGALAALGHMSEGCAQELRPHLDQLMPIVTAALTDPAQRCRYDAAQCLGRLIDALEGDVQTTYHAVVAPAIVASLAAGAGSCERVYGHVCATVINYCNQDLCALSEIAPYAEGLLGALFQLLQSAPIAVQEQAVTAVGVTAFALRGEFAQCYDTFVPMLKSLILAPPREESAALRSRAIECFGFVAEAGGCAQLPADCAEVAGYLAANAADGSDPSYVMPALGRMAAHLGESAPQLLAGIVQLVLGAAASEVAMTVTEAEEEDTGDANSMVLNVAGAGRRRVAVSAEAMAVKMVACRVVFYMADAMEAAFAPFVDQALRVMIPLVGYTDAQNVRSTCAMALPKLLYCSLTAAAQSGASGDYAQGVLHSALAAIMASLPKEGIADARQCLSDGAKELLRMVHESSLLTLDGSQVPSVVDFLVAEMQASLQRRAEQTQEAQRAEDYDADDLEVDLEREEELMTNLVDGVGYLIKKFGEPMLPLFKERVAPVLGPMLDASAPDAVRTNAVCSFDDVIEHCGAAAREYAEGCLPVFLQAAGGADNHVVLRQCATYGLAKIAQNFPDVLAPQLQSVLQLLAAVINAPDARGDELEDLTENAVSALACVCKHVPGADVAQLLPVWLAQLPLTADETEAQFCHDMLCDLVQEGHAAVLAQPEVALRVFSSILAQNPDDDSAVQMASPETRARVPQLVNQLAAAVPQDVMQRAFGGLDGAQQQALQAVVSA